MNNQKPDTGGQKPDEEKQKAEAREEKNGCNCEDCEREKREARDEFKEKYLRALADYHNLSRRIERERIESTTYAAESIIKKLLPALDDLERAKETIKDQGIVLIYNKLWNILKAEGLAKIEIQETDPFNPETMECIEADNGGDRLIELRSGYIMGGKVTRPVQVKVVKSKDQVSKGANDQ